MSIEVPLGVTLVGDTEQVARVGAPEQVRATAFEKAPNCEPTESVLLAVCPARMVVEGCAMLREKSLTVICTVLVGREVFAPPLLTVNVSISTPIGHIKLALADEDVPQLPDQLNVTGQLSGSTALPLKFTIVPVGPTPFTT